MSNKYVSQAFYQAISNFTNNKMSYKKIARLTISKHRFSLLQVYPSVPPLYLLCFSYITVSGGYVYVSLNFSAVSTVGILINLVTQLPKKAKLVLFSRRKRLAFDRTERNAILQIING